MQHKIRRTPVILRPPEDGFGYAYSPYRVENRPTYGPLAREELLRILDQLADAGVKAWWSSVSAKGSYPMFPSKYLPHRDDAVDYFPWLVEEAHRRGIAMFSWEYLTTAPMLAAREPGWRWKFFDWDGPSVERDSHYVCWNSPYGELLKKYCVEVVGELGFDGIWFDGAFMHGLGASGTFACCCDFCSAKYRKETGKNLPGTIDLRQESVREYMEWRYFDHTEYWRELSAYVRERAGNAIIVFNYFNRLTTNIEGGSPLRRMAGDAPQWPGKEARGPMEGMISAEVGFHLEQTTLLAKILRAVNDNYPVELWYYGKDTTQRYRYGSPPNPDLSPMLLHAYLCASAGAFASFGMGRENLEGYTHVFPALTSRLEPLAPYIPGEPAGTAAVVVSGCTKDYGWVDDKYPVGRSGPAWNAAIGMNNLLDSLRFQPRVLLDNMLSEEFLEGLAAVVLPGVRCMRDEAGEALRNYVKSGGTLLMTGETGSMDGMGRPRREWLFDGMFGVKWRDARGVFVDVTFDGSLTGGFSPEEARFTGGLPPAYRFPCYARMVRSQGSEELAVGEYNPEERMLTPQGLKRPGTERVSGAVVLRRKIGSGQAVWIIPEAAEAYGRLGPHRYIRVLVDLLLSHIERPFRVEGPQNVTVNVYRQQERTVVHVLNVPESFFTLAMDEEHAFPVPEAPHYCVPTGPVSVSLSGNWSGAHSPTGTEAEYDVSGGKAEILIPRLERYAMVVLED